MSLIRKISFISIILILLTGCTPKASVTPPPTLSPEPGVAAAVDHVVISEIMTGASGNNNYDFIELYNPTDAIIDLQGLSLWYQLNTSQSDVLLYSWETSALIPPRGHYLLLRINQDAGVDADAFFDYSLVPQRGSLALLQRDSTIVDQIGWGSTDAPFVEGLKAPEPAIDASLERLPGAEQGNGQDSDDNAGDFFVNNLPNPQNSASPAVPAFTSGLLLTVEAPAEITPGSRLDYRLSVTNVSEDSLRDVTAYFPVTTNLVYETSSFPVSQQEKQLRFSLGDLNADEVKTFTISFTAPWKYTTISVQGIYVEADGLDAPVFGAALRTHIGGGSVPIGIARTLLGSEGVIVEGTATMYTGGFYAGSSGTKFYLEDETGGIQVYVPGGNGKVEIPLGAYVRVEGLPQPYRGAIELVPSTEDVLLLKSPEAALSWEPLETSIKSVQMAPDDYAGKLVTLSGEVTRVEEFSYSFEMDLAADGAIMGVYIDKQTEIVVEAVEAGQYYQLTGILEFYDDEIQLNPRVQSDLIEIQPPAVTMSAEVPVNYEPGQSISIDILLGNHLNDSVTDLLLTLTIPPGLSVSTLSDGGILDGSQITWRLPKLEGNGQEKSVNLTGIISADIEYLLLDDYNLVYSGQAEVLSGDTFYSFPGDSVPVWAIQGQEPRSPYILETLQTNGVVTGVFPEMEGFWIQGEADENPSTSEGLFVNAQTMMIGAHVGDEVSVSGVVHEAHGETQLFLEQVTILAGDQPMPRPVELAPPAGTEESIRYYEALEGMLVQVSETLKAVSPTNKYGETALVPVSDDIDHLMQGDENGMAIRLDDGSFVTHTDQSSMFYAVVTGDLISGLQGPLAFNYGYYKIEPLSPPDIVHLETALPQLPPAADNQVRVMCWNVENLFDFLMPHPTDPALPTVAEYRAWLEKIAKTILLADVPVVIGFQEVEHIGVLEDLAATAQLAGLGYQAVLMEGTDSRGIDVGYLVRGDARIMAVQQFPAPEELTSRPPLLLEVQIDLASGTQTLFLLNNHFLSMSGGEQATEPRRVAQAVWNAGLIDQIQSDHPDAQVIVMGDLNSYYDSPPIDALRAGGLEHAFDLLEPEERYTYIYQGIAQVLDHMLANEKLASRILRVDILHTNADYPLQPPGDTSVLHKSDHDPLVVTFQF